MSVVHFPVWREDGEAWHLLVGNESVAQIRFDAGDPERPWLTTIRDYGIYKSCRVDFAELKQAKAAMEMWWHLTQHRHDWIRYAAHCNRYRLLQYWSSRKLRR